MSDDVTQISAHDPGPSELRPGDVLRGRFVIERLIGEGGMGKVFLAVDREAEQSNPFVALKMLGERFREHPQSLKALRREATQSRRLNHPNIVNVYDFDRTEGHVFMVMEYMRGSSLEDWLNQQASGRRLKEVWHILEACGEALHYLHERQIIHSDFKPGNVFVTDEGEIKVLDLGIARTLDETKVAGGTTRFDPDAFGAMTPQYASCEMFEGLTPNAQDDLFAFACVAYELLTGEHPYQRRMAIDARAERIVPKRPRGLKSRQWRALRAALAHSRHERPASVRHLLQDLTPTPRQGARLPWVAATVGLAVVATGVTLTQMRTPEERFTDALLEQYAESPPQPVSGERAGEWLQQGSFFLDLGSRSMDIGEYERGASQLFTGPSSAYQSFSLVLTRSDLDSAKSSAAAGMLSISQAFRDTVTAMLQRNEDLEAATRLACHGLAVNRFEPTLIEHLRNLDTRVPKGVASVAECRSLINAGTVAL